MQKHTRAHNLENVSEMTGEIHTHTQKCTSRVNKHLGFDLLLI